MGMQTQRGRSLKRERQIAAFSAELQACERKQKAKKTRMVAGGKPAAR